MSKIGLLFFIRLGFRILLIKGGWIKFWRGILSFIKIILLSDGLTFVVFSFSWFLLWYIYSILFWIGAFIYLMVLWILSASKLSLISFSNCFYFSIDSLSFLEISYSSINFFCSISLCFSSSYLIIISLWIFF